MAAHKPGIPLTTHVLNTADGVPGAHIDLSVHRLDPTLVLWNLITIGSTDEHGRCSGLIPTEDFTAGMYKIRFETGQYWEGLGQTSFYPYVEVVFTVTDPEKTFHLPLLLSRNSYSTYRGS
ncbi:5-hydroxyisourate hydrolase b [Brachyhypopomus gauderio]|uniref:5-hydroxyisourate hydrolase b n=1 Tax=Brachyhypopomus gauderio TaxID=698409 RepID=UPI0040413AAE